MSAEPPEPPPYPPAPWRLRGTLWAGLFRAEAPVVLPAGLRHLLGSRWLVVLLVRYLDGTLIYDELVVGSPARRGVRIGLFAHRIWVNNAASVHGGRGIWGLPKEMATFAWCENGVQVRDDAGPVADFAMDPHRGRLPPFWLFAPFLGRRRHGAWLYTVASLSARRCRPGGLRLEEQALGFPFPVRRMPWLSVAVDSFILTVPPPKGKPGSRSRR